MRKHSVILFLIGLMAGSTPAIGQFGFNITMQLDEISGLDFDDVLWDEDAIVIRGNRYIDSIDRWGLFVCRLDTNGHVLWQTTITDAFGNDDVIANTPTRFIKTRDGGYLLPVNFFARGSLGLYKLDSLGNVEFARQYGNHEYVIYPQYQVEVSDGYLITGTHQRLNYGFDVFALKTSFEGDSIWLKYYGSDTITEFGAGMVLHTDSTITIGCQRRPSNYISLPFSDRWRQPWLLTIDVSGEVVHEWIGNPNDHRAKGGQGIVHTPQGDWGMIYSEFKEIDQLTIYSKPTLSVLDSNYTLRWKHEFGEFTSPENTYFDLVIDTGKNEFIVCGQTGANNVLQGCIVKFSNDGEVLWSVVQRNSTEIPGRHYLGGVCISPTGSIYSTGYIEQTSQIFQYYGWILKVTADGCIDTLCTTSSILEQIQPREKVHVYPNPVTDQVNVEFQNPGNGTITTSIYNVFGKQVKISQYYISELVDDRIRLQFSMNLLPPGTYFMRIRQNDQEIAIVKVVKI